MDVIPYATCGFDNEGAYIVNSYCGLYAVYDSYVYKNFFHRITEYMSREKIYNDNKISYKSIVNDHSMYYANVKKSIFHVLSRFDMSVFDQKVRKVNNNSGPVNIYSSKVYLKKTSFDRDVLTTIPLMVNKRKQLIVVNIVAREISNMNATDVINTDNLEIDYNELINNIIEIWFEYFNVIESDDNGCYTLEKLSYIDERLEFITRCVIEKIKSFVLFYTPLVVSVISEDSIIRIKLKTEPSCYWSFNKILSNLNEFDNVVKVNKFIKDDGKESISVYYRGLDKIMNIEIEDDGYKTLFDFTVVDVDKQCLNCKFSKHMSSIVCPIIDEDICNVSSNIEGLLNV